MQAVLGINHGGRGVVAWNDPTTPDIKASASALAQSLATMKNFILSPAATFRHLTSNRIDVGMWTVGGRTLLLATNLNYADESLSLADIPEARGKKASQVFDSGAKASSGQITFESVGTGGFIFE